MQLIHVDSIWSLAGWIHIPPVPSWSPCCPDGVTGVQLDSTWILDKRLTGLPPEKKCLKSTWTLGIDLDSTWNLWGRVKSSTPWPSSVAHPTLSLSVFPSCWCSLKSKWIGSPPFLFCLASMALSQSLAASVSMAYLCSCRNTCRVCHNCPIFSIFWVLLWLNQENKALIS